MKSLLLGLLIFSGCASGPTRQEMNEEARQKFRMRALKEVRPLLKSDEFPYMECKERGSLSVEMNAKLDSKHNQNFGVMELREMALEHDANIMSLSHKVKAGRVVYKADIYRCANVRDAAVVDDVGMCKASKEKLVLFDYPDDKPRVLGEEVVKQMARYYAIENYFKTYHLEKMKYSYTKKRFTASASYFKCL